MHTYLNYLIEANTGILLALGLYQLLFRRETNFTFMRAYLLGGLLVALLFPLIRFPAGPETTIPSLSDAVSMYVLPEITIGGPAAVEETEVRATGLTPGQLMAGIYLAGVGVFFSLFGYRLFRLLQYIRRSVTYPYKNNYRVVETTEAIPAFSFFHYLFLGQAHTLSAADKEQILRHETVHADKFHSLDILLLELLGVAFWFNPFIRSYKKILLSIHEYQADAAAVEARDATQYCSLLAKVALQSADYPLANYFNQSLTTKRIAMIRTTKHQLRGWKVAFLLPMFAGFFILVACQDQVLTEIVENNPTLSQRSEYPPDVQEVINRHREKNPEAKFTYVEGDVSELQNLIARQKDSQIIISTHGYKDRGVMGVLLQDMSNFAETMKTGDLVYQVVEEAASPVGGMEEFFKYIGANLRYPAEARQANISGRVFIQFIVNQDGTLSNIEVLRGIGGGCDEEAVRVLSEAPAWNPGKQRGLAVRQRMAIPIVFELGTNKASRINPESIIPVNNTMRVQSRLVRENGQNYLVGNVKDENNEALFGVNVIVKGTNTGTITDRNGNFKISPGAGKGALAFSFTGYQTEEVSF
jgi:TonB family protein